MIINSLDYSESRMKHNSPFIRKFAWLPVRISPRRKVWLEHYWYREYDHNLNTTRVWRSRFGEEYSETEVF